MHPRSGRENVAETCAPSPDTNLRLGNAREVAGAPALSSRLCVKVLKKKKKPKVAVSFQIPGEGGEPQIRKLFKNLVTIRRTQGGCGGLGGENPAAFLQARPIFQQPFSLPENAQTLAGITFRAAGKSVKKFPAASKFAGKFFQQGISDSHSLLEFSETIFL